MLTSLTMFGWIPFTLMLFLVMPPKRAVVWCFFLAWLFLPMAGYKINALPDYTKMSASSAGVLLGALLFDQGRVFRFRPRIVDLPIVMFAIVSPIASSWANGLGLYDGLSETNSWMGSWTLPWFIGRVYFKTAEDMRVLALAFLFGAFAYIPVCLYEMRMAPTLHRTIYGFHQHAFSHAVRWGGYRPRGFMQSGLMTALYMCSGAVIGLCLWRGRVPVRIGKNVIPMVIALPILGAVAFFCKGTGAIVLAAAVVGVLYASVVLRTRWPLLVFMLISPLYIIARANEIWDGQSLVEFVGQFSRERAASLNFRFVNENVLIEKASQRPVFGWAGWNRSAVFNERGRQDQRLRRPLDHPLRQGRPVRDGLVPVLAGDAGADVHLPLPRREVAEADDRAHDRSRADAGDVPGRLPVQRDGVAAELPDRRGPVGHAADGPVEPAAGGGDPGGASTRQGVRPGAGDAGDGRPAGRDPAARPRLPPRLSCVAGR